MEKLSEAVLKRLHTMCRRPPVQKRRLVGNSGTIFLKKMFSHSPEMLKFSVYRQA